MQKTKIIGLLPASGKAERLSGFPKFLLPINNQQNLLQWHIDKMSEVCDEIRVSTRSIWIPLIKELTMPDNVKIYEIQPSTMPDACKKMIDDNSMYVIGMPDTYVNNSDNFYKNLADSSTDISVSVFQCKEELLGKVGQVLFDEDGFLTDVDDKNNQCTWEYMWGALAFKDIEINETFESLSIQLKELTKTNKISVIKEPGDYIDLGTFDSIKQFYGQK